LRPASEGGVLNGDGPVVEYVTGDVAPGVFVVARSNHDVVTRELEYLRLPGDDGLFTIVRPFHLASIEAPLSIGEVMLDRRPSFRATTWSADVIATAKSDIAVGTVLDGIGGNHLHGTAVDADTAHTDRLLPIALAATSRTVRTVPAGRALTYDDVELDHARPLV